MNLNGLTSLTITFLSWVPTTDGSVTMAASVSNEGLDPAGPFIGIIIKGYKPFTDQDKMDTITPDMMHSEIKRHLPPDPTQGVPTNPATTRWITNNLNGLTGVTVTLLSWVRDEQHGSVTMGATVSKTGLNSHPFQNIKITGYKTDDQVKMDVITFNQLQLEVQKQLSPDGSSPIPSLILPLTNVTLNHLTGVTITFPNIYPTKDNPAAATMTATVSKPGLNSPIPFSGIIVTGYKTADQVKMDGISAEKVHDAIKAQLNPSPSKNVPGQPPLLTKVTLSDLDDVLITLKDWTPDKSGSVTMTATVSKPGLNPHAAFTGITIKNFGYFPALASSKAVDLSSIPSVENGWSQKIDDNHYLIGTQSNGVYQVTIDTSQTNWVTRAVPIPEGIGPNKIPNSSTGFSQKIKNNNYLIGTYNEGVVQVTIDITKPIWTTSSAITGVNNIPSVQHGWSQQIDPTHYLIGTKAHCVYQVTVNATTGLVTKSFPTPNGAGSGQIPSVRFGWSQQIDPTHYLIAAEVYASYQITIDTSQTNWVTSILSIPPTSIPNVQFAFSQKIDPTHYLIGTAHEGLYQIKFTYLS